MANKINIDKLSKFISRETQDWIEKANFYENNKDWLDKSALIAVKILSTLRSQSLTQKDVAERIGVTPQYINKVVKGNENLSLETICKIERALGISLVSVTTYEITQVITDNFESILSKISRHDSIPIGSEKSDYFSDSNYSESEKPMAA